MRQPCKHKTIANILYLVAMHKISHSVIKKHKIPHSMSKLVKCGNKKHFFY